MLLFLTVLIACRKETPPDEPRDASRLEGGAWRNILPAHPAWQYEFQDGLLRQYVLDFGIVVSDQTYPYALRRDTVFIGGDAFSSPRRWVIYFHCDSLVECHTQGSGILVPTLYLKRMP